MTPKTTTPTLFPYTTLFRSNVDPYRLAVTDASSCFSPSFVPSTVHEAIAVSAPVPRVDRKSTRLNSSHANISYAVLCLKKKTLDKDRLVYEIACPYSHGTKT